MTRSIAPCPPARQPTLLRVELLLVGLHVDVALHLGAGGAELEAELAGGGGLVEAIQRPHATVLHRVLETGGEVGDELVDGTRIGSANVLRYPTGGRGDTYPL